MVNEDVDTQIAIDCGCDCGCPELAVVIHPALEKVMVCLECFEGLDAEFNAKEMDKDAKGLEEYGICGECGEYRPDDARVEGGMKCGVCAYG